MKLLKIIVASLAFIWINVAVAGDAAAVNTKGLFNKAAIKGYDAVAYWTEKKPVQGSPDHVVEWHGAKWQFSSAENAKLFKAEPEKYAPQYGGYCAWAMAQGSLANIDPDAWHIKDGKLYLNYNQSIQQKWLANISADISNADTKYPEVTNVSQF